MAGVVIAAAAGGAPRSHGTVPLRPGYPPPPFRRRRNRTGANGNIANHVLRRNSVVGRELVELEGSRRSSRTTWNRAICVFAIGWCFSLVRVLTSHSTVVILQLTQN